MRGMRFQDQHIVVTGGTRGIGRAISLALLGEGAIVHATYHGNDAAAEDLRGAAGEHAERLETPKFDVADHDSAESFWEGLSDTPVSGLVANSGIRRDGILATMKPEDWDAVIRTNLTGGYVMAKFAVQNMMRQRYGRIVFVDVTCRQVQGFEGQGNYCGVEGRAGRPRCARSPRRSPSARSRSTAVSPGFIGTELIDDLPKPSWPRPTSRVGADARRFGDAG